MCCPTLSSPLFILASLYNTKVGSTLKVYEYIYRGVRILESGKIWENNEWDNRGTWNKTLGLIREVRPAMHRCMVGFCFVFSLLNGWHPRFDVL